MKFATPIFDGASLDDLNEWTDKAGLPRYGKTTLYDGGTGEAFEQQATVGVTYMLKLGHMVEDKMHARSSVRTHSLRNSRWVVRHSSVVSVLEKWKFGHSKRSVPHTFCRKS